MSLLEGKCKRLFAGIDLHVLRWSVTVRSEEGEVVRGALAGGDSQTSERDPHEILTKKNPYRLSPVGILLQEPVAGIRYILNKKD